MLLLLWAWQYIQSIVVLVNFGPIKIYLSVPQQDFYQPYSGFGTMRTEDHGLKYVWGK